MVTKTLYIDNLNAAIFQNYYFLKVNDYLHSTLFLLVSYVQHNV